MNNCGYGRVQAYANSKLANVLFTKELHRRFHGKQVYIDPSPFFQTLNMKIDVNNVFCSIKFFFVKSFLHFFLQIPVLLHMPSILEQFQLNCPIIWKSGFQAGGTILLAFFSKPFS